MEEKKSSVDVSSVLTITEIYTQLCAFSFLGMLFFRFVTSSSLIFFIKLNGLVSTIIFKNTRTPFIVQNMFRCFKQHHQPVRMYSIH